MHTRSLLVLLPLLLACGGGHPAPRDTDGGHVPPGLFTLGDAGVAGSSGSTGDASAGDATVDPLESTDAEVAPDTGELHDAGVDVGVDAAVVASDAGHDAGPPPPVLADTCEPCVDHADCLPLLLCATSTSAGGRFCFPRTQGGMWCPAAPGSAYLLEGAHVANPDNPASLVALCTPHSNASSGYKTITCTEWRMLTGL